MRTRRIWLFAMCLLAASPIVAGQIIKPKSDELPPGAPKLVTRGNRGDEAKAKAAAAAGDEAMRAGEFVEAIARYSDALSLNDGDAMVWMKLGDAHSALAYHDGQNLSKAAGSWERAAALSRRAPEPRERLLKHWRELAEALGGESRNDALRKALAVAGELLPIDMSSVKVMTAGHLIFVELYLNDADVDANKVRTSIDALRLLQKKDPANAEIPFTVARAQAHPGAEAMRNGNVAAAKTAFDSATATMDEALASRPDDPAFAFRKAKFLEEFGPQIVLTDSGADAKEATAALWKQLFDLTQRAWAVSRPTDQDFKLIALLGAKVSALVGERRRGEAMLRDVLKAYPDDHLVRNRLAEMIRAEPGRQPEALQLLEEGLGLPQRPPPGLAGVLRRSQETEMRIGTADIRLNLYPEAQRANRPAEAAELLRAVDATMEELAKFESEKNSARFLRLTGKYQLVTKDEARAIETLDRALTIAKDPKDQLRYEIMFLLAGAHQINGNAEAAEQIYAEMLRQVDYPPARIELTRLLIAKRAWAEAEAQLRVLAETHAGDPEVMKLQATVKQARGGGG